MVLNGPQTFALSIIFQEVGDGLYAFLGGHTALMVFLLLVGGSVGGPGVV